jgi:predicted TIM-barrel fold metal-dependent hydrolase
MLSSYSRRELLAFLAAAPGLAQASRPEGPLVDTHIHLFASDTRRFPYHRNAPYRPEARTLEEYAPFVKQAGIDHVIIVHPEPYQDDHRYLEYCFANEPRPGLFKGTCLYDPLAPDSGKRMEALVRKHPSRITALRIHATQDPSLPFTTSGPIRDRDPRHPGVSELWRKAGALGLAVQLHMTPHYAAALRSVAEQLPDVPVIIDHFARAGQGRPEQYEDVLRFAKLPKAYMKFSGIRYSSRQEPPYRDTKPLVRRTFDAFGPDHMIWGGLGASMADFERQVSIFNELFDFASEADKRKIRGETAMQLFGFEQR